jgi:hypothetical protein
VGNPWVRIIDPHGYLECGSATDLGMKIEIFAGHGYTHLFLVSIVTINIIDVLIKLHYRLSFHHKSDAFQVPAQL